MLASDLMDSFVLDLDDYLVFVKADKWQSCDDPAHIIKSSALAVFLYIKEMGNISKLENWLHIKNLINHVDCRFKWKVFMHSRYVHSREIEKLVNSWEQILTNDEEYIEDVNYC